MLTREDSSHCEDWGADARGSDAVAKNRVMAMTAPTRCANRGDGNRSLSRHCHHPDFRNITALISAITQVYATRRPLPLPVIAQWQWALTTRAKERPPPNHNPRRPAQRKPRPPRTGTRLSERRGDLKARTTRGTSRGPGPWSRRWRARFQRSCPRRWRPCGRR